MNMKVLSMSKIDCIADTLLDIGAQETNRKSRNEGGDIIEIRRYSFGKYLLEISNGIRDGIGCTIAQNDNVTRLDKLKWKPIFDYTVPGYQSFTNEQLIDWVIDAPSGDAYVDFLLQHIRKLKDILNQDYKSKSEE